VHADLSGFFMFAACQMLFGLNGKKYPIRNLPQQQGFPPYTNI
jgi:hypothetical protein